MVQQRGKRPATSPLSIKMSWRRPLAGDISNGVKSERHLINMIRIGLQTIHPNPGPGRNKTEEGKQARRERRKAKRREKKKLSKNIKYNITTWNVQRMSLGTMNKAKARKVAEKARKENWDAVLLSEIRAEREGVAWFGEGRNLTVIVFSEKAGVLLRGDLLKGWCDNGQPKKLDKRMVSVVTKGLALTAVYLPVFLGNNEAEIEIERDILAEHKQWAKKNILLIGGDFNAHVGRGEEVDGVKGKFGMRISNERGRELIRWCEENGLAYLNSFYSHKKRGTWFNRMLGRWYELDGFLMRKEDRHRYVRKLCTVGEMTVSDHKPKKIVLEIKKWHWNTEVRKRTPKIRWEKLKEAETALLYRQKINELTENLERNERPESTEYVEIIEIVTKAAREVCGESEKKIENPWMVGKDEELQRMKSRIAGAVTERNRLAETARLNRQDLQLETDQARQNLREARRVMKRETRRWEKEWWDERITECQEAEGRGDSGKMCKLVKDLGKRYITSKKNKPPLMQVQEKGVNMQDVRTERGVKSIRLKIEKRCWKG